MALETDIQAAWVHVPRPRDEELFETDSEGALEAMRGLSWSEIDTALVDYHYFALAAFAPQGFAYFLPAFMLAALRNENLGVADYVVDVLSPPKGNPARPSFARRWQLLTRQQKRVVVDFLRHFEKRNPLGVGSAIAALESTVAS